MADFAAVRPEDSWVARMADDPSLQAVQQELVQALPVPADNSMLADFPDEVRAPVVRPDAESWQAAPAQAPAGSSQQHSAWPALPVEPVSPAQVPEHSLGAASAFAGVRSAGRDAAPAFAVLPQTEAAGEAAWFSQSLAGWRLPRAVPLRDCSQD